MKDLDKKEEAIIWADVTAGSHAITDGLKTIPIGVRFVCLIKVLDDCIENIANSALKGMNNDIIETSKKYLTRIKNICRGEESK